MSLRQLQLQPVMELEVLLVVSLCDRRRHRSISLRSGSPSGTYLCSYFHYSANECRSHILMIVFVVLFSAYFFTANKRQARGKKLVENTVSFLDIRKRFHADAYPGRLPVHILKDKHRCLDRIAGANGEECGPILKVFTATLVSVSCHGGFRHRNKY